jgi:hypothetical protein
MSRLIKFAIVIFLLSPTLFVKGSAQTSPILDPIRKFDEFGDLNCEDEYARLDNFAVSLQNEPDSKGLIIFYGGKIFRGRLPRRGDAAARAARTRSYLVKRRGLSAARIIVINGGYDETWKADLWIVPPAASMPTPSPGLRRDQIRFRKGKPNPGEFRCRI